jgi:hypothetical protein
MRVRSFFVWNFFENEMREKKSCRQFAFSNSSVLVCVSIHYCLGFSPQREKKNVKTQKVTINKIKYTTNHNKRSENYTTATQTVPLPLQKENERTNEAFVDTIFTARRARRDVLFCLLCATMLGRRSTRGKFKFCRVSRTSGKRAARLFHDRAKSLGREHHIARKNR